VDSAWEQRKPEARKMLLNRADSPASGARCVGRILHLDKYLIVIVPIVISMDTKLHTILILLKM